MTRDRFISRGRLRRAVRDASAFDDTAFLGPARESKRDPYRLSLFAQHLDPAERPLAFLAIQGGTLVVTDRRLLEFRAHLEVHGAWNVKEFQGYEVRREILRSTVRDVVRRLESTGGASRQTTDRIQVDTARGPEEILVSRGPESTLSEDDFAALRGAILAPQPK